MAVYLVSDGTNKPYRCKIRAPGFFHLVSKFSIFSYFLPDIHYAINSRIEVDNPVFVI